MAVAAVECVDEAEAHAACQCLVAAPVGGGWDCLRKVARNSIGLSFNKV